MELLLWHKVCYIVGISENNWHSDTTQEWCLQILSISQLLELPLKNDIYKYFWAPKPQYFAGITTQECLQLPNHSSLPELPFKNDVYQ